MQVQLPNGQIAEFPDDMPPDQIEAVLQRQFPPQQPAYDQRYSFGGKQPEQGESLLRTANIFSQGAIDGAAAVVDQVLNAPLQAFNLLKAAAGVAGVETGVISTGTAEQYLSPDQPFPLAGRAVGALRESIGEEAIAPRTATERFARTAGEFLGASAASGGLTPAQAGRQIGVRGPAVAAIPESPQAAQSVGTAIGAGVGTQAARELVPEDSALRLPAEIAGGVLGGVAGGKAGPTLSRGGQAAAEAVKETAESLAAGMTPGRKRIFDQLKAAQNADDVGIRADVAPDEVIAKYTIKDNRAVPDLRGREALKQGFGAGAVADIKSFDPATRQKAMEMVKVARRGKASERYAVENRPGDVAGAALLDRFKYVLGQNKKAGQQLDGVAKSLRGKPVSYGSAVDDFLASLDDIGVKLDENLQPSFKGSDIEGVTGAEKVIRQIVTRMRDTKSPDAYDAHRLKRYIDEQVSYGKAAEGLTGKTERILKQLRANVDGALDEQFPEYNRVNTQYSDTIRALDDFQSVAGSKIDFTAENADKAAGVLLRRMTSNAQSRVPLINAAEQLDSVAKKYGGKFSDDPKALLMFANELDSVFGPFAKTSMRSEVGKGAVDAVEAATQPLRTTAAKGALKAAEKLRGVNEENAFKAIEDLLKQYP